MKGSFTNIDVNQIILSLKYVGAIKTEDNSLNFKWIGVSGLIAAMLSQTQPKTQIDDFFITLLNREKISYSEACE